jgi:hypothetical protein
MAFGNGGSEEKRAPSDDILLNGARFKVVGVARQGNPAKIYCGHVAISIRQREYRI